jgi:hypothetical protein
MSTEIFQAHDQTFPTHTFDQKKLIKAGFFPQGKQNG